MKILILGGTVFLGRHLVEIATGRGHDVTLFNRGRSGPDLFAGVERLRGDRTRDVSALAGAAAEISAGDVNLGPGRGTGGEGSRGSVYNGPTFP